MGAINFKYIVMSAFAFGLLLFQNCSDNFDPDSFGGQSDLGSELPVLPEIFNQSTNQELNEGDIYSLYVEVRGLEGYTVTWYFNGDEIDSINSSILEIGPVTPDMSGEYLAIVRRLPSVELQSEVINVLVNPYVDNSPAPEDPPTPEPTPTTVINNNVFFNYNGSRYYLYSLSGSTDSWRQDNTNAFCKAIYGPSSEAVSYSINSTTQSLTHIAYTVPQPSCSGPRGNYDHYTNGFCLRRVNLTGNRYSSITCSN